MCLDFYTLERRVFGQDAKRRARVTGSPKIARFLGHSRSDLYNKNPIKIGDMRVDFYTLEHRECRAKRGARRERTTLTKNGENSQNFSRERQRLCQFKTIHNEF